MLFTHTTEFETLLVTCMICLCQLHVADFDSNIYIKKEMFNFQTWKHNCVGLKFIKRQPNDINK